MNWLQKHTGLTLVFILLVIHLALINNYGLTWDFHFHFFGGGKLLGIEPQELEPRHLPFVEPDPRRAWTLPYGPLMSIPPVASYLFFHKALNLLPADSAYHLPIILWGVGGILALYGFLKEAINKRVALFAAVFLATMPRFFSDMHNNMKDVPSATIFAVNMWLLWRLVKYKRLIDLLLAIVGFAVAFNVKVNSIFIPIIFAVWMLLQKAKFSKFVFVYVVAAPIAALILWSMFWADPIGQLKHAYSTFGIGTNNIEVLLGGNWYCSGSTVPWYYPYWYLAITTPLPILALFFVGLFAKQKKSLLVLWLLLPLTRYFIPTIGVIDGIRHFEEVLFPIAAIAAIGAETLVKKQGIFRIFLVGAFGWLAWNLIAYHPYQITYFNELVGGAKGAMGKYDLDYWGGSQKHAVAWVNQVAPEGANVFIFMAPDVASRYLRPDLLSRVNTVNPKDADYTIVLNRQSFYYRFGVFDYIRQHKPLYTVTTGGVPLVWVFGREKNTTTLPPWWQGEDPCIIKYW